jgi:hypothetical protein
VIGTVPIFKIVAAVRKFSRGLSVKTFLLRHIQNSSFWISTMQIAIKHHQIRGKEV